MNSELTILDACSIVSRICGSSLSKSCYLTSFELKISTLLLIPLKFIVPIRKLTSSNCECLILVRLPPNSILFDATTSQIVINFHLLS